MLRINPTQIKAIEGHQLDRFANRVVNFVRDSFHDERSDDVILKEVSAYMRQAKEFCLTSERGIVVYIFIVRVLGTRSLEDFTFVKDMLKANTTEVDKIAEIEKYLSKIAHE